MPPLAVIDLGRLAYAPALEIQRQTLERVVAGEPSVLLLVEHDPVITVSQREGARRHLVAGPALLQKLGIDVQPTDRGGDITYHGPGQLVAYPILRMADYGLNLSRYMRLLEQAVIDTVARYGVAGRREPGATGVWVGPASGTAGQKNPASTAKLCAMGVRIRRGVTMHGLAVNVSTDLSHFATIVPCGLVGRPVTSLRQLLGDAAPSLDQVKRDLIEVMQRQLEALPIAD